MDFFRKNVPRVPGYEERHESDFAPEVFVGDFGYFIHEVYPFFWRCPLDPSWSNNNCAAWDLWQWPLIGAKKSTQERDTQERFLTPQKARATCALLARVGDLPGA